MAQVTSDSYSFPGIAPHPFEVLIKVPGSPPARKPSPRPAWDGRRQGFRALLPLCLCESRVEIAGKACRFGDGTNDLPC